MPNASESVVVESKPVTTQLSKIAPAPANRGSADAASTPAAAAPGTPAAFAYVDQPGDSAATQVAAADAPVFRTPPEVTWHDGYYTGWGQSFHGDIEARVTIQDGRIVEAGIARCETRYPCSVVDNILYQPVQRQSPDVDSVSRATESSDAYFFGLVQALKKAEAEPATQAPSP
ncbi:MAG TPA: FMN-binding protein [Steroidobacteraceae bacterium]|nr:FMN-binding protein [Steroidobacteraceae bacterium]